MHEALGMAANANRDNGLGRFAWNWTEEEFQEFERATDLFNQVDPNMWNAPDLHRSDH